MRRRFALAALFGATALIAGCASGPNYAEFSKTVTPVKEGEGRVYFFRSNSMMGAAVQPDIRLNTVVVGSSKPGGFFYVDRPAGQYTGAASTETEKTLSFALAAGETKYVRTSPSFGLMVGRVNLELEDPAKAQAEIATLSYTGSTESPAKK